MLQLGGVGGGWAEGSQQFYTTRNCKSSLSPVTVPSLEIHIHILHVKMFVDNLKCVCFKNRAFLKICGKCIRKTQLALNSYIIWTCNCSNSWDIVQCHTPVPDATRQYSMPHASIWCYFLDHWLHKRQFILHLLAGASSLWTAVEAPACVHTTFELQMARMVYTYSSDIEQDQERADVLQETQIQAVLWNK